MNRPLNVSCAALVAAVLSLGGWSANVAAQEAGGVAYITSQDGDISVLSLDKLAISETIHADGKGPRGLGITADGKLLITANRDGGDASIIDLTTKKVIKHIPIGKNPEFVRVQGDQAFVSFEPSSKGGPPPKPGEEKKAEEHEKDDDEDLIPAKVAIIDLKKQEVVGEVTSGPETEGIEFSHDGKALLLTNEADNTVTIHELPGGKLIKTIDTHPHGDRPRGVKAAPDGSGYVVTLEFGNKVLVLDKNYDPVKTFSTGESPYGIAYDPTGKHLYVAASKSKELQVFDGKTFEPIKNIPVKDRCWHFTFSPDNSKIVVSCGRSNNVLVFDATSYELLKDIPVAGMPWGVVAYPKAMGSLDQR